MSEFNAIAEMLPFVSRSYAGPPPHSFTPEFISHWKEKMKLVLSEHLYGLDLMQQMMDNGEIGGFHAGTCLCLPLDIASGTKVKEATLFAWSVLIRPCDTPETNFALRLLTIWICEVKQELGRCGSKVVTVPFYFFFFLLLFSRCRGLLIPRLLPLRIC